MLENQYPFKMNTYTEQQIEKLLSVIDEYAKLIGIPIAGFRGRSQRPEFVIARQVWWRYLNSKKLGYSYIGRLFGYNHSTIHHGVKHATELIDAKDDYAIECVNAIEIVKQNPK